MANNLRPNWSMIRVRPETLFALKQMGLMLQREYREGRGTLGSADRDQPTMDEVITVLLQREEAHRDRGRAYQAREKAKRAQKPQTGPEPA